MVNRRLSNFHIVLRAGVVNAKHPKRFTDSRETHDERGLKHRDEKETRPAPIPPELVAVLRDDIDCHGVAADCRREVANQRILDALAV
ncbi:hypothetical protein ABT352_14755 [Streptosporangium sp. NPDC000563]|uniref:hypothetical protein n=1 Tax=unclassified Streptosporangium TaxID=2632669 RepID=UPI0033294FBA